jgi:hypothetical protein
MAVPHPQLVTHLEQPDITERMYVTANVNYGMPSTQA